MFDRKILISAVKSRPALWHHTHKDFKKSSKTDRQWEEVARLCHVSNGADAKKKWKNLRRQFRRERQRIPEHESNSESAATKWPYFELMSFLKDVSTPIPTDECVPSPSEHSDNETDNSINMVVCPEIDTASTSTVNTDYSSQAALPTSTCEQHEDVHDFSSETEQNKMQPLTREILLSLSNSQVKSESSDMQFFRSLLPFVAPLPPLERLQLRHTIQQAVLQYYQQWQHD